VTGFFREFGKKSDGTHHPKGIFPEPGIRVADRADNLSFDIASSVEWINDIQ
jgi:hypothetical protein